MVFLIGRLIERIALVVNGIDLRSGRRGLIVTVARWPMKLRPHLLFPAEVHIKASFWIVEAPTQNWKRRHMLR